MAMAKKGKKKKTKIKVELELPKDDSSETVFQAILMVGILLGMACMGFWILNADLVFKPVNQNPMFVNLACGFVDEPSQPTYEMNQSCALTQEQARPEVWTETWERVQAPGLAKKFHVPGMSQMQLAGQPHPTQPMDVSFRAEADSNYQYNVSIWHRESNTSSLQLVLSQTCVANEASRCKASVPHVDPTGQYEFWMELEQKPGEDRMIKKFDYTVTVMSYDGVPEYMNNASLWVGPELSLGPMSLRPTLFVNFFGIGLLVMVYPAAVYRDKQFARIEAVEEKFPDFLRDLAEYWKGGLSMTMAVKTLASSEYGALNSEIKKMSDQISWGIAFGDVLTMFAHRVGTPLVLRAVSLVTEANKAGGKISDILVTAANDSREIKYLDKERERAIGSYIAVIWVSFMVFLGVIVVLSKVFIPAIASSNSGGESETIGNMQINAVDPLFFLVVFFYGVSAQALGNGAMAGLMATGRFSTGMKHAGMMLIICIAMFNLAAFSPDLIGVPMPQTLSPEIGAYQPGYG